MAFSDDKSSPFFSGGNNPHLISIYAADSAYTELPRAMHRHDDVLELILIRKGAGTHILGGRSYATEAGDLIIINSGTVHDESSLNSRELAIYSCALAGLQLPKLPPNHLIAAGCHPLLKTRQDFSLLSAQFQLMYDVIRQSVPHAAEIADNLLRAILLLIMSRLKQEKSGLDRRENELLSQICAYLDSSYMEPLALEAIAGRFHVNPFHLAHMFKKFYGYPLMGYVNRRRIGEAQTLLIDTALSITDIALTVGYSSSSHFSRAFQKAIGMAPRNYRNLYRQI